MSPEKQRDMERETEKQRDNNTEIQLYNRQCDRETMRKKANG